MKTIFVVLRCLVNERRFLCSLFLSVACNTKVHVDGGTNEIDRAILMFDLIY